MILWGQIIFFVEECLWKRFNPPPTRSRWRRPDSFRKWSTLIGKRHQHFPTKRCFKKYKNPTTKTGCIINCFYVRISKLAMSHLPPRMTVFKTRTQFTWKVKYFVNSSGILICNFVLRIDCQKARKINGSVGLHEAMFRNRPTKSGSFEGINVFIVFNESVSGSAGLCGVGKENPAVARLVYGSPSRTLLWTHRRTQSRKKFVKKICRSSAERECVLNYRRKSIWNPR